MTALEFMARGLLVEFDGVRCAVRGPAMLVAQARDEVERRAQVMTRQLNPELAPWCQPTPVLVPGDHGYGCCRSCGELRASHEHGDCVLCALARIRALKARGLLGELP